MRRSTATLGFLTAAAIAGLACERTSSATPASAAPPAMAAGTGVQPIVNGQTDLSAAAKGARPVTKADVDFMSGMIAHHAQAVIMAGWAPSHKASASLQRYCERVVVGQSDEIRLMQQWLKDHGQPVPDAKDTRMHMTMNGKTMDMLMPGMLSDDEMKQLDQARGVEWDRLFLQGMIKHHGGAIDMVNTLNSSNGAAQDEFVFKLSNDIYADQMTEITRMQQMLAALPQK